MREEEEEGIEEKLSRNVFSVGNWLQSGPTGKSGTKIVPEVSSALRQRADLLFSLVSQSLAAGCPFLLPCLEWRGITSQTSIFYLAKCNFHSLGTSVIWARQQQHSLLISQASLLWIWGCPHTEQDRSNSPQRKGAEPWHTQHTPDIWIFSGLPWDKWHKPSRLIFCSLSSKYSDLIHKKRWHFTHYYCNRYTWK